MANDHNIQRHIYLVDDDEEDRELFSEALSLVNQSIGLIEIPSAFKLIEMLNNPDVPKPDIIFLDINMPKVSGLECLKVLMSSKQYQHLKVVILSTFSQKEDIEDAYANGARNYFVKPPKFNDLQMLIAGALELSTAKRAFRSKKNFLVNYSV
jgi:CheY-like chemotaxis protein